MDMLSQTRCNKHIWMLESQNCCQRLCTRSRIQFRWNICSSCMKSTLFIHGSLFPLAKDSTSYRPTPKMPFYPATAIFRSTVSSTISHNLISHAPSMSWCPCITQSRDSCLECYPICCRWQFNVWKRIPKGCYIPWIDCLRLHIAIGGKSYAMRVENVYKTVKL